MGEKGSEKVNEIIRFLKGLEKGVIKGGGGSIDPESWTQKVTCCLPSVWSQVPACTPPKPPKRWHSFS